MALALDECSEMDERHRVLPVESQPEIANPLSEPGDLALLYRSPLQVHDANATQGQEPGQRGFVIVEDFLVVCCGNAQLGVPIISLWKRKESMEGMLFHLSGDLHPHSWVSFYGSLSDKK